MISGQFPRKSQFLGQEEIFPEMKWHMALEIVLTSGLRFATLQRKGTLTIGYNKGEKLRVHASSYP